MKLSHKGRTSLEGEAGLLVVVHGDLVELVMTHHVLDLNAETGVVTEVDDGSLDVLTDIVVLDQLGDGVDLRASQEHGRGLLSGASPGAETLSLENVTVATNDLLGAVGGLSELTIKVGGVLGERRVEVQVEHGVTDGEANLTLNPGNGIRLDELLVKVGGKVNGATQLSIADVVGSPAVNEAAISRGIVVGREEADGLSKTRVQRGARVDTELEELDKIGGHGEGTSAVLQQSVNISLGLGEGTLQVDLADSQTGRDSGALDDGLKVILSTLEETDLGVENSARSGSVVQLVRDYSVGTKRKI